LLEQGEESSAACFSDIPVSVRSRLSRTAAGCCSKDSATESCPASPFGMTCELSTVDLGEAGLMSSPVASHARTSAWGQTPPVAARESRGAVAASGVKWPESLAKYDHDSSSWRTRQCSLFEDLGESLETFPYWGMTRSGECFPLDTSGFGMSEPGCSFMPTPTKLNVLEKDSPLDAGAIKFHASGYIEKIAKTGNKAGANWPLWVLLHGYNPTANLAEHFMGWPTTWTALEPLETGKFLEWLRSHGEPCLAT